MNYYNEFDPAAAQWLRNLITAGLIPAGDVDERSIEDVKPADLAGYTQCHFFAGIGGWPEALRLAGVPDAEPLWTGSCPCQPYSAAGKGGGSDDPRNLWWAFRWLIDQCRPAAVLGEQVASKAGRGWLAGVRADLEALGYAVGAADLCAAGAGPEAEGWVVRDGTGEWEPVVLGAPHIRQRVFWVADAECDARAGRAPDEPREGFGASGAGSHAESRRRRDAGGLADATGERPLPGAHAGVHCREEGAGAWDGQPERLGPTGRMADTHSARPQGRVQRRDGTGQRPSWQGGVALECADGKIRRIPESVFLGLADGLPAGMDRLSPREGYPLAQGVEGRVTALKGIGNAIVPQVAAEFITSWREARCHY